MSQLPLFEKKKKEEKKEDIPVSSKTGGWQRYTTGFGEKFMKKFGFEGRLGKDGQGIAEPIAVKKRPEGLGLGADGFKEASSLKANREIAKQYNKNAGIVVEEEKKKKDWWKNSESEESESDSDSEERVLSASESDSENERPKRKEKKKVFKTLQQLLEEQNENAEETDFQPIVFTDHTGRKTKTRTLEESSLASVNRNAVGFEMIYNIEKITSAEEMNVRQFSTKNRRREEMKKEKQLLVSKMKSELDLQTAEIQNLESILRIIQTFTTESSLQPKTPLEVLLLMEDLQMDFPVEYYRYKLFQLLPSLLQPAIQSSFSSWNPLTEAKQFEELVYHVKDIMLLEEDEEDESHLFSYDWIENPSKKHEDENRFLVVSVFTNTLLKPISAALSSSLNLFDTIHFESYLILLKTGHFLWNDKVLFTHFTKPIISKLKSTINSYSSSSSSIDPISFFQAILQYQGFVAGFDTEILPLLSTKINSLLETIPSLNEARLLLLKLKPLFKTESPATKRILQSIENTLILKLARNLRLLVIDPSNQENIDLFINTLQWSDCLDHDTISAILEGEFFNQWLFVLYSWIHQENVDWNEVVNWIEGWRSLFPQLLLENPFVIKQFNRGWDIVNDCLDHTNKVDPSYFEKPISYINVIQNRRLAEKQSEIKKQIRKETAEFATMNMRDAMMMWGEKNNIEVSQIENKTVDGKQVFLFGNLQLYIAQNITFVKDKDGSWKPQSLQDLISLNSKENENTNDLDCFVCFDYTLLRIMISMQIIFVFYYKESCDHSISQFFLFLKIYLVLLKWFL